MKMFFVTTAISILLVLGCKFGDATADANRNSSSPQPTINLANTETNLATPSATPQRQAANAVCPDPSKPCHHKDKTFDAWELSFKMPTKLAPNKPYASAKFYAVMLKTYPSGDDCDGGEFIEAVEAERKALQRDHLTQKVFASYECPNMAAVDYDFAGKYDATRDRVLIGNFLAIYAGPTKKDADALIRQLKPVYPEAAIKEMTASYEVIDQ